MQTAQFTVLLLTPTFLGDAAQAGAWRTPPFKALFREWWRIAAAPGHGYDHRALRQSEGTLFGNAWLDSGATQSNVRLALKHWDAGTMTAWEPNDPREPHPEVRDKTTGKSRPVGSQLYLGYGPLKFEQGTALKANPALQAGKTNTLSLAWPETETSIPHTLQLIDWFGTVGGRGRNGWGSLSLNPEPLTARHPQLSSVLRDLRECLKLDWPHAIGKDTAGPLVWESAESFANWQDAMKFLARTKIGFRTHLKFPNEPTPHRQAQDRHVLSYPVTNHDVQGWSRDARLANQLRFKLFRDADKQLRARIYHTPHSSPLPMGNLNQLAVWQRIHRWLDDPQHSLTRLGAQP